VPHVSNRISEEEEEEAKGGGGGDGEEEEEAETANADLIPGQVEYFCLFFVFSHLRLEIGGRWPNLSTYVYQAHPG
jgi:hypothetical protein